MKAHNFIRTIPMKLYLLLLGVILFAFFSNDFGLVDIQKTAVILAAGIDKTEEGFSVTAQIAVPKGTDRTTGGTSSVQIEAEGKTVSDCISLVFAKTGWVPKLVFCNLLLLGEEAVGEDIIAHLNYFLRNEYMNDSCMLAVCEGKAHDFISSKSAIDDTSSLAIEKLFSDAAERTGKVTSNTLKDFAIGYFGVSKSSYLPFVRSESQKSGGSGTPSAQQTAASSGNSGSSGSSGGEEEKIYIADKTAIFSEGKMVAVLSPEETLAFNLLHGKVVAGTFGAKDKDTPVTLTIVTNDGKITLDMKGAPTVKLDLQVMVRLCCRGTAAPIDDISHDDVNPEILKSAKEVLTDYVSQLWNTAKESGCDLFQLKKDLFRSSAKKYREWESFLLDSVKPEIKAEVTSMK